MSGTVAIQRRIAWSSMLVHLPIIEILCATMYWGIGLQPWTTALMAAAAIYLLWSILSKAVALGPHRRGLGFVARGLYEDAGREFSKSYERFCTNNWIDRYRVLILLDSSAVSYREMALINMGYAELRAGQVRDAWESYRKAFREFPGSAAAREGAGECERLLARDTAI
jgi:tetratricopeptide (TPR) repeat protein